MPYGTTTDNVTRNNFIDKNTLLKHVSEEEIFSLVFGFLPEEMMYCTSPFRKDNNPYCFFSYSPSGKLTFTDWANYGYYGRIRLMNLDCFAAVQVHFNIPSFLRTLEFLWDHFVVGNNVQYPKKVCTNQTKKVSKTKIQSLHVSPRMFNDTGDKEYWSRFGITKSQLISDRVFPINKFQLNWSNGSSDTYDCYTPSYAFTGFKKGRKKIFITSKEGKSRFMTDCKPNDIGGLNHLQPVGRQLIIKKSYKDYRIMKNYGLTSIWLQSEVAYPDLDVIIPLCKGYKKIVVLFDNDSTGVANALAFREYLIPHLGNKVHSMYLPTDLLKEGITDPADLYKSKGSKALQEFLIERKILSG